MANIAPANAGASPLLASALHHFNTSEPRAPAGLSFGKAVAAMLALKERSAPGCAGRDPMLRRQRELLLNIRLADVFGMQVRAPCQSGSQCLLAGLVWRTGQNNLRCIGQRAIAAPQASAMLRQGL